MIYLASRVDSSSSSADSITTEDLLKRPGSQEQEKEAEHDRFFKAAEKKMEEGSRYQLGSLRHKAQVAKYQAIEEKDRKSREENNRRREKNEQMRRSFEDNLTREYIVQILNKNSNFLNYVASCSRRHQQYHHGTSSERQGLYNNNFGHIISSLQTTEIIEELKTRWSLDEDYVERVLLPEVILAIYADYHQMSREEANQQLMTTDLDQGSEETAAIEENSDSTEGAVIVSPENDRNWRRRNRYLYNGYF